MDAAYSSRDFDALAKLAHWLKGAGGTVGFDEFFEPARELEFAIQAQDLPEVGRRLHQLQRLAGRIRIEDQVSSSH
ncbi:MAG: Hpt domain-containing protein [Nitrospirales bacterium]|nr:Hpt domain-containing protein [Nitrospirales bacterium]